MFLLIVIVILIASASILGNIYMGIFSLQQNYGDINNYYNSYYAAISSIERGLLVTKYKEPSFVGSGGFIGENHRGEASEMFSGDFGKFTEGNNGLVWEVNSRCQYITGILNYNNTLTLNSMLYGTGNTGHYEIDSSSGSYSISNFTATISGNLSHNHSNINLINGNIHRQLNERHLTGFVVSSGNTMIDYQSINNNDNIYFNNVTIDPVLSKPVGNTLCSDEGCFSGKTISDLIIFEGKTILYIQDRLIGSHDGQIGKINFELDLDYGKHDSNCPFYTINGNGNIGNYKNTLQIKKPAFNYKNPYRQDFIFPYYN